MHVVADAASRAPGVPLAAADDFFAAGGTSREATTWVAKLASAGISVSLRDLFEKRTPQAVAAEREASRVPRGDSVPFVGRLGATARQRRYTRVYLPRGKRNWANMTSGVPLGEESTADAAVHELIARHDSLRAIVDTSKGEQVFLPVAQCTIPPIEQLTAREWESVVSTPIDVGQWPPHRWAIRRGTPLGHPTGNSAGSSTTCSATATISRCCGGNSAHFSRDTHCRHVWG
ncbi:phosphopantetheine-binding protein [Corynebacterium sp. CCM 9204]|uniref:phosphopantetheine-binding protein n=1 Tax=Corynebacterium sp. CCM 9204 TaxID=3057616 RepID=UPI003523E78B